MLVLPTGTCVSESDATRVVVALSRARVAMLPRCDGAIATFDNTALRAQLERIEVVASAIVLVLGTH